jgi:class 3 adenylate cyclase
MENLEEKVNILYVDDEEDNLIVFRSAFRRFYKVHTATSGEAGLNVLKTEQIALIITDQRMPSMTGIQFLQQLPDEPYSIRMILTGFSDVEAIIAAINTGKVYRYITKPWDKDELKITIDRAIEAFRLRQHNIELVQELQMANEHLEEKVVERTAEVNRQKEQIEQLLLNILPAQTAEELKATGKSKARSYQLVTVLFADIKDFTLIGESLSPETLVAEIDYYFRTFDNIISKYDIEKIKTIGDAYMCAGGLPNPSSANPVEVVQAALEMQQFVQDTKQERLISGLPYFEIRIGLHSGPVVAGIVGHKKFAYDIWGDTVNTAARMESCSEAGKVNISGTTYALIKDHFACTHRGKVEAKNKGQIDMYFVDKRL